MRSFKFSVDCLKTVKGHQNIHHYRLKIDERNIPNFFPILLLQEKKNKVTNYKLCVHGNNTTLTNYVYRVIIRHLQ